MIGDISRRCRRAAVYLLFSVLFLGVSGNPAWADVELVRDGASEYEIVLPEAPTKGERFAASELQHYVQLMTGAQLPIPRSSSGPSVLIYPSDYRNQGRVVWDEVREQLISELEKRGMVIEVGGHGYQNYLSPENYFDEHPEWFAMKDGERTRDENWMFNTTNEEALDELTANVIDYLRAHPEIDIFDLWPPEGGRWSQDPQSLAQGNPDDRQAVVTNHVAQTVKDELPGVKVEFIAYSESQHPPETQQIPAENTLVDFADYSRSYAYPIWNHRHPENAKHGWGRPRIGNLT